jgi:uncharacterized protein YndB with AHSA1/START domain
MEVGTEAGRIRQDNDRTREEHDMSQRVTRVRDVAAAPSAVWAVLADFESIAEWAPDVDHSCLMTDESGGVGAARRVQAGRVVLVERVVAWEPELLLAYSLEGFPPIVGRVTNTWLMRPLDGEGDATRVTLITDIDPAPGLLGKVVALAASRRLARASRAMLNGIADTLEDPT